MMEILKLVKFAYLLLNVIAENKTNNIRESIQIIIIYFLFIFLDTIKAIKREILLIHKISCLNGKCCSSIRR